MNLFTDMSLRFATDNTDYIYYHLLDVRLLYGFMRVQCGLTPEPAMVEWGWEYYFRGDWRCK